MSTISKAQNALDAFFEDDIHVLVLKGAWGIGKTHFWNCYINKKKEQKVLKQTAYSYVSLFGLNSLKELREKIFHNGIPLKSDKEVENKFREIAENEQKLYKFTPWVKDLWSLISSKKPFLGWVTKFGKDLPYLNQFASVISMAEYGLVNNYVVCLDDIERKGNTLSIKEIMGLVDELSVHKNCKVILIFNYQSLDENQNDQSEYDKYREKVVDLEIKFDPSIKENLIHVFSEHSKYFETLLKSFQVIDISNIRIFKKAEWAINKIEKNIVHCVKDLQNEIITHLSIFCWGFYNAENSLPLRFVSNSLKGHSWLSLISDKEKEQTEETKRWNQIASSLALRSSEYDDCLISLLENGYLEDDDFISRINKINEEIKKGRARDRLFQAWEIYSGSFDNNQDEFLDEIQSTLDDDIDKIGLWDFSSGIDVLEEFGRDTTGLVAKYIKVHRHRFAKVDMDSHPFGNVIKNATLMEAIKKEKKAVIESIGIDELLTKIAFKKSWNPEDIVFLSYRTVDDLYSWMKSNPSKIRIKIQKGLQLFDRLGTDNIEDRKRFLKISEITKGALIKIASENSFNRKRVKLFYKIDLNNKT